MDQRLERQRTPVLVQRESNVSEPGPAPQSPDDLYLLLSNQQPRSTNNSTDLGTSATGPQNLSRSKVTEEPPTPLSSGHSLIRHGQNIDEFNEPSLQRHTTAKSTVGTNHQGQSVAKLSNSVVQVNENSEALSSKEAIPNSAVQRNIKKSKARQKITKVLPFLQFEADCWVRADMAIEKDLLARWPIMRKGLWDTLNRAGARDINHSLEFIMAGKTCDPKDMIPTILFLCEKKDQKKLKKLTRNSPFTQGCNLRVIVGQPLEASTGIGLPLVPGDFSGVSLSAQFWDSTVNICGVQARALLDIEKKTYTQPFTLGGVVLVDGRCYALTTSHSLLKRSSSQNWWPSTGTNSASIVAIGKIYAYEHSAPYYQSESITQEDEKFDWALIDLPQKFWTENSVQLPEEEIRTRVEGYLKVEDLSYGEVWICSTIGGIQRGVLNPAPAVVYINGSGMNVRSIRLEKPLADGESGSWVIRDGKLCGYIYSRLESRPWAYMIPVEPVFNRISKLLAAPTGRPNVEVPSKARIYEVISMSDPYETEIPGQATLRSSPSPITPSNKEHKEIREFIASPSSTALPDGGNQQIPTTKRALEDNPSGSNTWPVGAITDNILAVPRDRDRSPDSRRAYQRFGEVGKYITRPLLAAPFEQFLGIDDDMRLPVAFHDHTRQPYPSKSYQESFLLYDLDISRLNNIHPYLWMAGRFGKPLPLHRHKWMGREIAITEQADLHLVWSDARISLKPLPRYLLRHSFWEDHICRHPDIYENASGFLLSYIWLIRHESDYKIALEAGLLPLNLTWDMWVDLAASYLRNMDTSGVNKRYLYGELKLARLNAISYIAPGSSHKSYQYVYDRSGLLLGYFPPWLFSFTVFLALGTLALQLGLETEALGDNDSFQAASFGFTMFATVALAVLAYGYLVRLCFALFQLIKSNFESRRIRSEVRKKDELTA